MSNADKILEIIKSEHIAPAPRWRVLTMRVAVWALSAVALALGSIAFAVVIFIFANQDWDLATRLNIGAGAFYLAILPYFWLVILAAFALGAYYNFRHTKRGYRFPVLAVIGAYIIITIVAGAALYRTGVGAIIEQAASNSLPYYNQMIYARAMWVRPDAGLLAGKVVLVENDQMQLIDLNGKQWTINISSSTGGDLVNLQTDVKIIGRQLSDTEFAAEEIRPWCGCSGCMRHRGQSCLDHCRAQTQ